MGSFRLETTIPPAPAACFELSLSVDAHAASMSGSNEQAVDGVTAGAMALGDTATWRARHFGIAFRMTSAITVYEHPRRFIDEQLRGPFATWWHEHTFTALDTGDTLMVDVVRYTAPFRALGTIAERIVLDRYLTDLLQRRNSWLKHELVSAVAATHGQEPETSSVEQRTWVVWRQDDNGNRAEVARHTQRADAERHASTLEARGHKQTYWVTQTDR